MKKYLSLGCLLLAFPLEAQDSGAYLALRQAFRDSNDTVVQRYIDSELARDPDNIALIEEAVLSSVYNLDLDAAKTYSDKLKSTQPNSMAVEITEFSIMARDGDWLGAADYLSQAKTLNFISPQIIDAWALVEEGMNDAAIELLEQTADEQGELAFIFDYQRAMILAYAKKDYQAAADVIAGNGEPIYLTDLSFYSHLALLKLAKSPAYDVFMDSQFGEERSWPGFVRKLLADLERGEIPPSLSFASPQSAVGEYISALTGVSSDVKLDAGVERLLRGMVPAMAPENGWFMNGYANYFFASGEANRDFGDDVQATGQFENVLRFSERISPQSFVYAPSQQTRVNALFALDRDDEAREWADAAESQAPDELAFRADVYRRLSEYEKAVENYEASLAISGDEQKRVFWTVYGLAISYERLNEWDKAEEYFLKALEIEPDNADALNYLGYSYVDRGIKLETGLEMIEKAVEIAPNQGHIIDSLGWAYYRLERYDDALEPLETATMILSTDAIVNAHLGDLYWKLGRKREARYQWERSIRFLTEDTQDLTRAELEDRLQNGI